MRSFFYRLTFFVIGLIMLNCLFAFLANNYYYKPYLKYMNETISLDTYLFADSHGYVLKEQTNNIGIFNVSFHGESYLDIKRKLKFFIKKNPNIKNVILSVDNHMLSNYRNIFNNNDRSVLYSNRVDFDSYGDFIFSKFICKNAIIPGTKVHSYITKSIISKFTSNTNEESESVIWENLIDSERKEKSDNRLSVQFPNSQKSKSLENQLEEIIKICQNREIELVGIKFPCSKEYNESLNLRNTGADSIFFKYGIKVLDFQKAFVNQNHYFLDQDHLNKLGAKEFIKMLDKSVFQ